MRLKLLSVALMLTLGACANPQVPDFMVEGSLPRFGGNPAKPKAQPAAPVVAQAPVKPETSEPEPVRTEPTKPVPPVVTSAPAPVAPTVAKPQTQPSAPAPVAIARAPAPEPVPTPVPPPAASPQISAPPPLIVGGFQPLKDKRKAQAVAAFAADAAPIGYLLKDIESVRSQVVAGTNYELCLKVRRAFRETSGWRTRLAKAEVFEDLSGNLTLMDWSEVETCP